MNKIDWTWAWKARLKGLNNHDICPEIYSNRFVYDLEEGKFVFLHLSYRKKLEEDMLKIEPKLKKYKHMILLGIGGSALGARALQKAFYPEQDRPNHQGKCLWIADNIDVESLESWYKLIDPKECLVVVVSKSGGTIETISQYFLTKKWLEDNLPDSYNEHLIFVTDANKGYLREEAIKLGSDSLEVPDNMGGRYSIFSAVGIVPAAFLGIKWKALLDGAESVAASLLKNPTKLGEHNAWKFAHYATSLYMKQYSELIFFNYIPQFSYLGPWFVQLWAESLGKNAKGTMPISAIGVTDQHSSQQMFLDGPRNKACIFLTAQKNLKGQSFTKEILPDNWSWLEKKHFGDLLSAEALGTSMALTKCDVPLVQLSIAKLDEFNLGALMTFFMASTVFTGWLLGIDPLNQEAVELGKTLANAKLGADNYPNEVKELKEFVNSQDFEDLY